MARRGIILVIVACIASGCQSGPESPPPTERGESAGPPRVASGEVLAYVAGEPVRAGDLLPLFIESSGGELLGEVVLDEMLRRRLDSAGLTVTPDMIEAERAILSETLDDDPDQAARLLGELRERRGLGEVRFAGFLKRNAALRALVADRVTVAEPAVRQAYRLTYGPSARVRLLIAESLDEAQRLRRRAVDDGEPFGELAALHSTDASAAQGGLLSPIRQDDTSYPAVLRSAVAALEPGQVSEPVALGGGFALLKLEENIPGSGVDFDDVKGRLEQSVRRRAERVLMQQVARELVSAAELVVLDPTLKNLWDARRQILLRPQ